MGCGSDIKEGYINLDVYKLPNVDVVHNLSKFPYPFKNDYFKEILSYGTLELINADFIRILEEIWRISSKGAIIKIISPAFPNFTSAQDPLTRHFRTYNTFEYFKGEGYNYYSKARFKTLKRKYIYSRNKRLKWLSFIPNISPKFYTKIFSTYFLGMLFTMN